MSYKLIKKKAFFKLTETVEKKALEIESALVFISNIKQGNFDVEYGGVTSNDAGEGNALAQALLGLRDHLKSIAVQENQLAWINEGLAMFSGLLRASETELSQLYDNIIRNLVKYLKANQGGLFVLNNDNEEGHFLELVSCYAYNKKKILEKRIEIGQGLIGQAYLEQGGIMLTEVPENYVNITSGLGEANPRCILIVPMKVNDKVYGMLELASFNVFENFELEFIEKLGENIAATISIAKINQRTRTLLLQAQEQAEIMRNQEEEMRQNMEELQATQEEVGRNNAEMAKLLEEAKEKEEELGRLNREMKLKEEKLRMNMEMLRENAVQMEQQFHSSEQAKREMEAREKVFNVSTVLSESDLFGNILYVNDKFCEVSKYSRQELVGQPHKMLRHPDMPREVFRQFWKTIKSGEVFRGIIKNRAKDGTHYWVDAVIAPVLNEDNKPFKYIGARYVIEDDAHAERLFEKMIEELKILRKS